MMIERAKALWSTWVGNQDPATFVSLLGSYGSDLGEQVHTYVAEIRESSRVFPDRFPSGEEAAEAVEAILRLILQALDERS